MTARKPVRSADVATLAGRVALVTGAGRGVGRAVAEMFARRGADVVITSRTSRQLNTVARSIERQGVRALAVPCDVRDARAVDVLIDEAIREFRRLDILVNNAGTFQIRPFADTDTKLWDEILDTNLKGTFLVTRAALPHLVRRRGRVINVASIAARIAFPGSAAYCASKAGVLALSNVLREEVRSAGVSVSVVLPGAIDTPIWNDVPGDWNRKTMMRPRDVARVIAELCATAKSTQVDEITLNPPASSA